MRLQLKNKNYIKISRSSTENSRQQAYGLLPAIFSGTPRNLEAIAVASPQPLASPWPLASDLLLQVKPQIGEKMYLQGFQPSESSLKLLFILCENFLFFGLCPASVWLSSLGLSVQPRKLGQTTLRPRLDNLQTLARQLRPQNKKSSRRMKSSLSATFFRLLPLQNSYS